MQKYEVKALTSTGEVVRVAVEASGEAAARRLATERGFDVIAARALGSVSSAVLRRAPRFPLILFTQELLSLLEAGVRLQTALETLAKKERAPAVRRVVDAIVLDLTQGRRLSDALQKQPEAFTPLYVATVRASEKTGDLREALGRFIGYLERVEQLKRKVISALIYPAVLLSVGGLVVLFLVFFVVPRFSSVYEEIGENLPWLSRILVHWGRLLSEYPLAIALTLSSALGLAGFALSRPGLRTWIAGRAWRLPKLGERLRIYALARFYRTLGMLLRSGMGIEFALAMAGELLPGLLREKFVAASRDIESGLSIAQAMDRHGLSTEIAQSLLRVGEQGGNMGDMMERIAVFYDEEMSRWIDWITRLFEPLLMAVIGVVIGGIVVMLYMPIFELAGRIQ